jgi:hypothetical protein
MQMLKPMREQTGHGYDEEAFRYFLRLEQKRAARANRSCLLLLIELKTQAETIVPMDPKMTARMFAGLSRCLRETDFFGWYRDGRVAGAVLTQHGSASGAELPSVVRDRVSRALGDDLPPSFAGRLLVRLYRLAPDSEPKLALG